jgi:uncharacterized membrane protein YadS
MEIFAAYDWKPFQSCLNFKKTTFLRAAICSLAAELSWKSVLLHGAKKIAAMITFLC